MKANSNLEFIRIDNGLINLSNVTSIMLDEKYQLIKINFINGSVFTKDLHKNYGYIENSVKELFDWIINKLTITKDNTFYTYKFLSIKREVIKWQSIKNS
jgi:hypothetical protein